MSISSGKLQIRTPTQISLKEVLRQGQDAGDRDVLSQADLNVLALALDLHKDGKNPVVVSDDYAIQNVAEGIGLSYQSLATLGYARSSIGFIIALLVSAIFV